MEDNNLSVDILNSGERGVGKSTISILMVKEYLHKFSFICPHCGGIFYKNLYRMIQIDGGYKFYIPEEIKNGSVMVQCPIHYMLDLKTGEKKLESGCGKTFYYSQRKRVKFTAKTFIAYDNAQAYKMLLNSPIGSPLIFDEAINFMSSLDFNKADSKELKRLLAVIRPRKYVSFYNVPEILWLDKRYREDMAHFWIWSYERGSSVLFEKNKAITDDKWCLKELRKHIPVLKAFSNLQKIKKSLQKHPCFFDLVSFGELDEKEYTDYELYRNSRNIQKQIEEASFSNKDIAKLMCWNLLNKWDSLIINVNKSREQRMTYSLLVNEVLKNPLTYKPLSSEPSVRSWVRGVDSYVTSKGSNVSAFSGDKGKLAE